MKILKRAQIPKNNNWDKRRVYPFHEMGHGDSFEFKATNTRDPVYSKIYAASNNFAKRRNNRIKFEFAEKKTGVYGCWMWELNKVKGTRKPRITKQEISKINRSQINKALSKYLTIKQAAQSLNISTKTFNNIRSRLINKQGPKV